MARQRLIAYLAFMVICVAMNLAYQARAAILSVDASAEVAAAVYMANATLVAFEKEADEKLRELHGEIETLQAEIATGNSQHREELAMAQQTFVTELAAKDRAYAQAIAAFRRTVTDIVSTPEGAAALAQYNAGHEEEALAILERLSAANDAARAIQSAGEKRRIAQLAIDALYKGKLTTADVILLYEKVTRLDPQFGEDWRQLSEFYVVAGRLADARKAAAMASQLAADDQERAKTLKSLSFNAAEQGHLEEAEALQVEAVGIMRHLTVSMPDDSSSKYVLSVSLSWLGDLRMAMGNYFGAAEADLEALELGMTLMQNDPRQVVRVMWLARGLADAYSAQGKLQDADRGYAISMKLLRSLFADNPHSTSLQRNGAFVLEGLGDLRRKQKDMPAAFQAYQEAVALRRALVVADPSDNEGKRFLSKALAGLALVKRDWNDPVDAIATLREALEIERKQVAADPGFGLAQLGVAFKMQCLAGIPGSGVTPAEVNSQYDMMQAHGMLQHVSRSQVDADCPLPSR